MTSDMTHHLKSLSALVMALALTACGESGSDNDTHTETPPEATLQWGSTSTLMNDGSGQAINPNIAISESGDIVVVWLQGYSDYPLPSTVWGRYYDQSTETWEAPRQLDNGSSHVSRYSFSPNPKVVFAGETAVVSWEQAGLLYSTVRDENGWSGNPQRIHADGYYNGSYYTGTAGRYISLAPKNDGSGVVAVYQSRPGPGPGQDGWTIRTSEFSLVTRRWTEPVPLDSAPVDTTPHGHAYPLMTDPETGSISTAWQSAQGDIKTATYDAGEWTPAKRITNVLIDSADLALGPDSQGDQPVVFFNDLQRLGSARYLDNAWSISTIPDADFVELKASAIMADGDLMIVFSHRPDGGNEPPQGWGLSAMRFDLATGLWEEPTELHRGEHAYFGADLATGGNGQAVMVYDHSFTGESRVISFNDSDGWSTSYQPANLQAARESNVVMNDAGNAALVWRNKDGNGDLYVLLGTDRSR